MSMAAAPATPSIPPAAEEIEEELLAAPEDPIQQGGCRLFMQLTSAETGEPVTSRVSLFRLDVPANEHYTAGDQMQVSREVPKAGLWIDALPEGRYRIHAHGQRHPSSDPGRFSVRGETTRVAFALPMPRRFRASLIVYDGQGRRLERAKRRRGSYGFHSRRLNIPWRKERKLRHSDRYQDNYAIGLGGASGGRHSWRRADAIDGAFDLGTFREDRRDRAERVPWTIRLHGLTEVMVQQRCSPGRDQTYVAIAMDAQPILDSVYLPDGRMADVEGARFSMLCWALLAPQPLPADHWRKCVVAVRVRMDGYEDLKFEVRIGEALARRTLKALVSSPSE